MVVRAAGRSFGIPLERVVVVERMVAVTLLPDSPDHVDGVIDLHGEVVAVVCLAVALGLRSGPPEPSEHLLFCRLEQGIIALRVTEALGLTEQPTAERLIELRDRASLGSVLQTTQGLVVIPDLESLLADLDVPKLTATTVPGS